MALILVSVGSPEQIIARIHFLAPVGFTTSVPVVLTLLVQLPDVLPRRLFALSLWDGRHRFVAAFMEQWHRLVTPMKQRHRLIDLLLRGGGTGIEKLYFVIICYRLGDRKERHHGNRCHQQTIHGSLPANNPAVGIVAPYPVKHY
ncbi:hypothetical protein [Rhizobium sp. BK176]|uniref:hypothetical protein n=1 Tax=Rhizobium sp. BK176 TaxID=2587071 RepID=UPI002168A76D|nr:hypothetical protein [Rhizobium sp. BK176]MCS4088686.1 hypothetical protein [Rhizobium sp. BK176]